MNRKGYIAEAIIPIFFIMILTHVLITYSGTIDEFTISPIGAKQFSLYREVQLAEKAQTYLDVAAKHSLRNSIVEMASDGGFHETSSCGSYGNFQLWKNDSDYCRPDVAESLESVFGNQLNPFMLNHPKHKLNRYLSDGRLLTDNFEFSVDTEKGLTVVGVGKNPWLFGELYYTKELERFPVVGADTDDFTNDWHNARSDGKRYHLGTDIMGTLGNSIVIASKSGTVTKVGCNGYGGNRVGITDDEGTYFYYAHLESIHPAVRVGQRIEAGQQIGLVGDTIGCTCPNQPNGACAGQTTSHLHFGIYVEAKDNEDTIGDSSAYNPYYSLLNALNGKDIYELARHPSFEYRITPAFRVRENYNLADYEKIWDVMQLMSEEFGSQHQMYADSLDDTAFGAEKVEPPQTPYVAPSPPTDLAGVPFLPEYDMSDMIDQDGNTGFDWLIEYDGELISDDAQETWDQYCESPEEKVLGDIGELFYGCSFSKDSDCLCQFEVKSDTYTPDGWYQSEYIAEETDDWPRAKILIPAPDSLPEEFSYSLSEPAKDWDMRIAPLSSFTWMPSKITLDGGQYSYDFVDNSQRPPVTHSYSSSDKISLYRNEVPFSVVNGLPVNEPSTHLVWMRSDGDDRLTAVDDSVSVIEANTAACELPKVLKVCVINKNREIIQIHRDANNQKVLDFAPVVYRFAYHLKPKIPDPIDPTQIEVQDKFRYKGAVVMKWPDVTFSEDSKYMIYYSKGSMNGFTKEKLDEVVQKTKDGEQLPQNRKKIYSVELSVDSDESQRGNIAIDYMYYNAPEGKRLYVSTVGDGQYNDAFDPPLLLDPYNVTELYPNHFYHFSNPHFVYVLPGLEDGVTYHFTIVGINEDGEYTTEQLYSKEGKSINDAPPDPLQNMVCELNGQDELICTFDPFGMDADGLQLTRTILDANGNEVTLDPEQISPDQLTKNEEDLMVLNAGKFGADDVAFTFNSVHTVVGEGPNPTQPDQTALTWLDNNEGGGETISNILNQFHESIGDTTTGVIVTNPSNP